MTPPTLGTHSAPSPPLASRNDLNGARADRTGRISSVTACSARLFDSLSFSCVCRKPRSASDLQDAFRFLQRDFSLSVFARIVELFSGLAILEHFGPLCTAKLRSSKRRVDRCHIANMLALRESETGSKQECD